MKGMGIGYATSFVMHAVRNPDSVRPTAARRPAPPAPITMALYGINLSVNVLLG